MPENAGSELRRRREALGLELDRLSEATAIPEDYLRALEAGAVHQLPPGPYAGYFARTVRRALERLEAGDDAASSAASSGAHAALVAAGPVPTPDGDDGSPPSDPVIHTRPVPSDDAPPARRIPVAVVRGIAMASTALLAVQIAWLGAVRVQQWQPVPAAVPSEPMEVRLVLRANARLRVQVDGRLVAWRTFAGGEDVTYRARERVEVDVPHARAARVWFDGRSISPQGHLDRPRTFVFVDDGGRG